MEYGEHESRENGRRCRRLARIVVLVAVVAAGLVPVAAGASPRVSESVEMAETSPPAAGEPRAGELTGRLLVKPTVDLAGVRDLGVLVASGAETAAPGWLLVEPDEGEDPTELAAELAARAGVAAVEPEVIYRAQRRPPDPCADPALASTCAVELGAVGPTSQWYLDAIGTPGFWERSTGSSGVVVAVLDSGIRTSHRELRNRVVDLRACGDESLPSDEGHGTQVASLIAAAADGRGMVGVGWNTRVGEVRVLGSSGSGLTGTSTTIAAAIRCVVDRGVPIINMSFAGPPSQVLIEALDYAAANGVIMVAAAGNSGRDIPRYPAAHRSVIGVGALGRDGRIASFSNTGWWVDLVAPGDELITASSLDDDDYSLRTSGTSFSAPLVAGAAALVRAWQPSWTGPEVRGRLLRSAGPLDETGVTIGRGVLDLEAAADAPRAGYWMLTAQGEVIGFGDAAWWGQRFGSAESVGLLGTASGRGYRVAYADGDVRYFGDAADVGSLAGIELAAPIVGASSDPNGDGFWLLGRDGGVFSFGGVEFHGSTGDTPLNEPVVAMAAHPSGEGYWFVASDGGVFSFGAAEFHGSLGDIVLNEPVVGMAPTPSGEGYWLVASDGGIFSFGDARFYGSTGSIELNSPIAGMIPSPQGAGYLLVAADGGVFAFGEIDFLGSTGASPPASAVVALDGL